MSGVLGGLFASLKSGIVNLVTNGSFTVNDITGWTGDSVFRATNLYKTTPAALAIENPDTDANAVYTKTNALTIGNSYSLSFWIGGVGNTQSSTIVFYAGTNSQTLVIPTRNDSTWTYQKIENVLCTGNTTLAISFNSPYLFYIDDVSVVAGATAV